MLRIRRTATLLATAVLLGGTAVVGYFEGGFFDETRLAAAAVAWLLVLLASLLAERPLPRGGWGRIAIAALVLLSGWTLLSMLWAPLPNPALADGQRVALYAGALIAAIAWLGSEGSARAVEPGLALGAVILVAYGMSERYLPGVVELPHSRLAFGRLEQPLTYWNGMGLLAAIGLVLCSRLAGGGWRRLAVRVAAAGAAPLFGAAILLTLSRSAIGAAAAGLLALVALSTERGASRSAALVAISAGAAGGLAAALPGLTAVGEDASRSSGAVLLAASVLLATGGAGAQWRLALRRDDREPRPASGMRRVRLGAGLAAGAVVLITAIALVGSDRASGDEGAGPRSADRLASLDSARYRYWEVALAGFGSEPVQGLGSSAFRVEWAREAPAENPAVDAHSLLVETAAELGLVGLALLGAFLAGVLMSARRALGVAPQLAIGPAAVLATWTLHASVDWDWELPGVTLPALLCAGLLVALADRVSPGAAPERAGAPRA